MNNRILITGANGQLGSEIKAKKDVLKNFDFYFTDINELDITSKSNIDLFVKSNGITHIINCAAYTAVDLAEEQEEKATLINQTAVKYLAEIASDNKLKFIHISTDYVFNGMSNIPYKETDEPNPNSVYGKTKLAGENEIIKLDLPNSIIIRTAWLYSKTGGNFVKTMLNLGVTKESIGVVFDQTGSPTFAGDLADAILKIIPKIDCNKTEIYHFSNEGVISWYDFAKAIFYLKGFKCKINPIHTDEYPTLAKRPNYSVLDKTKIKNDFDLEIPYWFDSLQDFLSS